MSPQEVSEEVIRDLEARFSGFPIPGKTIYPSRESPEDLEKFGLPPKPDPDSQPELSRVWDAAFDRPIALQAFKFDAAAVRATRYRLFSRQDNEVPITTTRFESSSNWSGAYVTANRDRRFLQVWGKWKIPGNLEMPKPPFEGRAGSPYVCSDWIGLDGQRLYLNSSLPQIGTVSTLETSGQITCQAWTQWWARQNLITVPVPIGLMVQPGNEVFCVLTAQDPQTVWFAMINLSVVPAPTVAVQGKSPTVPVDGSLVQVDISGATAEWIVERPKIVDESLFYNFPNYGHTAFHHCVAVEGKEVDISALPDGLPQELQGAQFIRMFDVLGDPDRTVFISVPKKLDETAISVQYVGS